MDTTDCKCAGPCWESILSEIREEKNNESTKINIPRKERQYNSNAYNTLQNKSKISILPTIQYGTYSNPPLAYKSSFQTVIVFSNGLIPANSQNCANDLLSPNP